MTAFQAYKLRVMRKVRSLSRREDGAVAIEFALIAIPFFALLFGIIELAIVFFLNSSLEGATFEAARKIRTGQFTGDEDAFETEVCQNLNPGKTGTAISGCKNNLEIRVTSLSGFSQGMNFQNSGATNPDNDGDGEPDNFVGTAGGDTVLVAVRYKHPLTIPGELTRLSNVEGENSRYIYAVSAFRNEPF